MKTFRMKLICIVLVLLTVSTGWANENLAPKNHKVSLDFGSYRGRYFYAINNLQYDSPIIDFLKVRVSARLRSYGTWVLLSRSSYGFTPTIDYWFVNAYPSLSFSAGLGADARLRLVNDVRSDAKSSVEPLLQLGVYGDYKSLSYSTKMWTRFYSNGVSYFLLPQISYQVYEPINIFFRYEVGYLEVWDSPNYEIRHDLFLGLQTKF